MGALKGRPYTGIAARVLGGLDCVWLGDGKNAGETPALPVASSAWVAASKREQWITIWKFQLAELKQTLDRGEKDFADRCARALGIQLLQYRWVEVDSDGEHSGEFAGAGCRKSRWCVIAIMGCGAWMSRCGCGRRELRMCARWLVASIAGRLRLIPRCRGINSSSLDSCLTSYSD